MTTRQAFLYIVGATYPDTITCRVPWEVDRQEVFFGPCKKRLREKLREYLLGAKTTFAPRSPIWLVGFNPSNPERIGRVLWAGRIKRLMTFSEAYSTLNGPRYARMRDDKMSPLHVKPIMESNQMVGYERRSELHAKNYDWIGDLVTSHDDIRLQANQLRIPKGQTRVDAFPRDLCALCENLFFARKRKGLVVDDKLIAILRRAQPMAQDVDGYGVFGYRRKKRRDGKEKSRDGKRGGWVEVNGPLVDEIVEWIRKRARTATPTAPANRATVRC